MDAEIEARLSRLEEAVPTFREFFPHIRIRKADEVLGLRLKFRLARPDDAAFVLSLRLDPAKNQHLSAVADDVEAQRRYIEESLAQESEAYFIIETMAGEPVGTVRLYDQQGPSFSWGSWILSDNAPKSSAVESTMMVYRYALFLGFRAAHFEVRKANEKVWQYHERMGARRTHENEGHFYYGMDYNAILATLDRYEARLPEVEVRMP